MSRWLQGLKLEIQEELQEEQEEVIPSQTQNKKWYFFPKGKKFLAIYSFFPSPLPFRYLQLVS